MKKVKCLLLFMFLFSVANAQSARFQSAMQPKVRMLDTVIYVKNIKALFFDFQRIALIEKNQWLPYYYMAFCKVRIAGAERDKQVADQLLDEARNYCNVADSFSRGNSEILALKARIALTKIPINMIERGAKYSSMARMFAESAIKKDPANARAHIGLGMYYLYTPDVFGGDKVKACEIFKTARTLLNKQTTNVKDLNPNWGDKLLLTVSKGCN
jgi:hypothetical protein